MYVVVEMWTPTPAFLAADEETRTELFARIQAAITQLAQVGFVTLGWGKVEPAENSTSHEWFAVWQAPSRELADRFLGGVESSGWYGYFEQSNVVGELRSVESVIADQVALEVVVK